MTKHIGRQPTPEDLHHRPGAILGIDAGAAEFKNFAGILQKRRNVIFARGIEAAGFGRSLAPDQAIGADDRVFIFTRMIENKQMIAMIIKRIEITVARNHGRSRGRAHFFVKDAITKGLRGVDFLGRHGKAHFKAAKAKLGIIRRINILYCSHS